MVFIEKYRPCSMKEIEGQEEAIARLKSFILNFGRGKKAVMIGGPAGCGKTSLALCLAKDLGFEIFELNASDFRNKDVLNSRLKQASEQKSFFAKSKILLVDEVDGLSGNKDRGGIQTLITLIEGTRFPIIITGNDIWQQKLNALRNKCELIPLKELHYEKITNILEKINKKEKINTTFQTLRNIAINSKGDARAAINDLQIVSAGELGSKETDSIGERDKEETIFEVLRLIFKTGKVNESILGIFNNVNMELDTILLWLDENLALEYKDEELARAYEMISQSDRFKRRIMRQQYWRFLVYQNMFLSAGITAAKKQGKTGFTSYKKPSRILNIWLNNQKQAKKKTISEKFAKATHKSKKLTMKNFVFIEPILRNNQRLQKQLNLDEDEIAFLRK